MMKMMVLDFWAAYRSILKKQFDIKVESLNPHFYLFHVIECTAIKPETDDGGW